jgi:hypothetical protein
MTTLYECLEGDVGPTVLLPCRVLLGALEDKYGWGPKYLWQIVTDMANVRMFHTPLLRCVAFEEHSRASQWARVSLTNYGWIGARAEMEVGPPVPLGLINGSIYRGGKCPPFLPLPVLETLGRLCRDGSMADGDIRGGFGDPVFPGGCRAEGDFEALRRGAEISLTLRADVRVAAGIDGNAAVVVTGFPPTISPGDFIDAAEFYLRGAWEDHSEEGPATERLPIAAVFDASNGDGDARVEITVEDGVDPEFVLSTLNEESGAWSFLYFSGLTDVIPCVLPGPLEEAARRWARSWDVNDALEGVAALTSGGPGPC